MRAVVLLLIACLPHSERCKQEIQRPMPANEKECDARMAELRKKLAGTIDDAGYVPLQVLCMYGDDDDK